MTTDLPLLQLIWLASPALPIGGFSYSEGVEAAVDAALVTDEASAAGWLLGQLHLTLARADLAVLAQAIPAWQARDMQRIGELDAWVLQTRETSELRQQAEQMGRSLIEWLRAVRPELLQSVRPELLQSVRPELLQSVRPEPVEGLAGASTGSGRTEHFFSYPVAFALAASAAGASTRDCLLAFAFGWAENMVQAALKSVPLGQSAGQRVLGLLARDIPAAVDVALALHDEDRQAFSPMLAILSARHETQYSRLFRS
ncbi:urease accessory protein UreF [Caenimonas terrae]|uniref:Urease accessory protein UreF n=1 Tax=Caenimonas terrae TaxID=696074 RepID=A0ABW0NCK9_9BURK